MGFASSWLGSGSLFPEFINEAPDKETGIIIVVPAFDEPLIIEMLDSLAECQPCCCNSEVIIVINAPLNASSESLENNLKSISDIEDWKKKNKHCFFRIYVISPGQQGLKGWGVGLARKTGMDEALRRFNSVERSDGVIVNLDADCTVQRNYFVSLENELLKKKEKKGCSIYFEHAVSGDKFPVNIYDSIYLYELHLRYYYQALLFTGFPNVFHTVGSSIAVKSMAYMKAGGMNRRQAGEDFYFVQKLIPAGGYFSLNSTTIFPSPRVSGRVPFGTGAAVGKMVKENSNGLLTYNPLAFKDLYMFFEYLPKIFENSAEDLILLFYDFPESIRLYLEGQDWLSKITEIKNNTSGYISFRKRFFEWFNMFRVVKYLNFSHKSTFEKVPVIFAAEELLRYRETDPAVAQKVGLLEFYRSFERDTLIRKPKSGIRNDCGVNLII
jgi:hypothetical protein